MGRSEYADTERSFDKGHISDNDDIARPDWFFPYWKFVYLLADPLFAFSVFYC
jgi:hypothetical protein